ncbi:MAG: glutathione S-transferase family protein [Chromatiales bacterium]|jgi:glutathione S-transferase|nr:glutathione S-transferase family protein [Chromatiales bacterium]MDH4014578.1 glutathione S-transferase family protein [Chromatiales bacterium]PLX57576.1 MAG: glutathione S-transferase [Chromatiales bacterium]
MKITLYEYGPTRSQRARWALLEAGLEYESVEGRALIHSDELRKIHPLGKVPAAVFDGKPLFESAAICTYIADLVPEKKLIAASGTWERALHDQWVAFALSELEAFLWHSARNQFVLPEDKRLTNVFEQNAEAFSVAAVAMEQALSGQDYLVGNRFSVTDIVVGFTINWARGMRLLKPFPNLRAYVARLFERPHCTLTQG